jgi:hypothetical protein
MAKRRVTVQDASEALDISVDAVRQRIRRGKLTRAESPDDDKRVYVWLDTEDSDSEQEFSQALNSDDRDELLAAYRDQVEFLRQELARKDDFLRRELERKDTIIMSLTQRIPELEAVPEQRNASVTASESHSKGGAPPEQEQRRSWLYRFLFGP